jgi:hypothetical protein
MDCKEELDNRTECISCFRGLGTAANIRCGNCAEGMKLFEAKKTQVGTI